MYIYMYDILFLQIRFTNCDISKIDKKLRRFSCFFCIKTIKSDSYCRNKTLFIYKCHDKITYLGNDGIKQT